MERNELNRLVDVLKGEAPVSAEVWKTLLTSLDNDDWEYMALRAREVAQASFGKGVYVRALVEISSYCRNNCLYCGLRFGNRDARRYRLSREQVLECCREGAAMGFNTFVLQGGEDPQQSDEWLAGLVADIKTEFPEKAVTLSVGERSAQGYTFMRQAGADRYLLRHETADNRHYSHLHPRSMSADNRKHCLYELKRLGFQVGSGMMVGSPGQQVEHLIADLMFLDALNPQMIGIGPFIPANGTPFATEKSGSVELTLHLISLLRLRFGKALIPATTALATLCSDGTERGILAGANVVMPNLTPSEEREKYAIYDNKKSNGSESAWQLSLLQEKLRGIGYHIDFRRGDYEDIDPKTGEE